MTGRERWERATEYPLLALGLAFLVAYALPIIDPDFPEAGTPCPQPDGPAPLDDGLCRGDGVHV